MFWKKIFQTIRKYIRYLYHQTNQAFIFYVALLKLFFLQIRVQVYKILLVSAYSI